MASIRIEGGGKLEAKLRELARKIGSGRIETRVGFFEKATYPDGTPVAMIAAIQNFGSAAQGIPPRPFFSNMIEAKSPVWGDSFVDILKLNAYDVRLSLELLGEGIAGQLRQSIVDTNSPPLSPVTIARKGFEKPLIDDAVMFNSISSEIVEGGVL